MLFKSFRPYSLIVILILFLLNTNFAQNLMDINGKKQGKWIKYQNGIKTYEGQFVDDIPVGEFLYFYPNGNIKIKSSFSEKGLFNRAQLFFDSPMLKLQAEGNYRDKKKDSTWNYYNEQGILVLTENYSLGLKNGEFKVFNHFGQLNLHENYINDKKSGLSSEYYETGELFRQIDFENGKRLGKFKVFYPNGKLLLEGKYKNDVRDSIWTTYTEQDEVEFLDYYANGLLQKRTDKLGNKLKIKQEEKTTPLNIDPSEFDPKAIKR